MLVRMPFGGADVLEDWLDELYVSRVESSCTLGLRG